MLGQIIIDDKCILTLLHELFAHRTTCIRGQVLQRSRVGGPCHYDDGMLHRAVLLQNLTNTCNKRVFLANGNIDTDEILALLVDDCVKDNSSLTRLAVADDQFTLTASNGDHAVDSLNTGLHRRIYALPRDNSRGNSLHRARLIRIDWSIIVDWLPKRVDHTTNECITNGNGDNLTGGTDFVVFFNVCKIAKNRTANRLFFEVKSQAPNSCAREFY